MPLVLEIIEEIALVDAFITPDILSCTLLFITPEIAYVSIAALSRRLPSANPLSKTLVIVALVK
jgi:hypothetical protein